DDDGEGDQPLTVRATVTVDGDQVRVDFAGTADQTPTNINCPFASTIAAALSCVKSVLTSPDIPFNEGSKRPITVTAPYGSLVNPRPGAPVRAHALRIPGVQRGHERAREGGAGPCDRGGLRHDRGGMSEPPRRGRLPDLPRDLRRRIRRQRAGRRV